MTGLSRVPAFDKFRVLKASDVNFRRVTVLGNNKRTVPDKDEDTPEHILFIPEFDTREALAENLLHVIYNHDPACPIGYVLSNFGWLTSSLGGIQLDSRFRIAYAAQERIKAVAHI